MAARRKPFCEFGTWPRLHSYKVNAPSELQRLQWTREGLKQAGLDKNLFRDVDRYLRLLGERPKVLRQLLTFHAGRKPERALEMAFHYLVLYKKNGPGGSAAARKYVARVWSKSEPTIRDAYTDHKTGAQYLLNDLLSRWPGRPRGGRKLPDGTFHAYPDWTEETVIEAIAADMDDRARMRLPSKSGK